MRRAAIATAASPLLLASFVALASGGGDGAAEQPVYAEWFSDEALRVDLVHSGTRGREVFGLDELVAEPIWPGTRAHLVDPTGYGKYRFRVFDLATDREIFRQGYCTLFGEWLTTPEAAGGAWRSMPEPLRMPFPLAPIELAVEVRDDETGGFAEIHRMEIDTSAYDIRPYVPPDFETLALHDCGREPPEAVDVVIVPDGYTVRERDKLSADARRFSSVLLEEAPFDRHRDRISLRLVVAFSRDCGPDEPRKGLFGDTAVGTSFDTFGSPRYLTTADSKALREVAAAVPYDAIFVMVNSSRYGGGGIFGSWAIFTSDAEYSEYVMIHEFGHGFGALADEYYYSSTGYDEDAFYAAGIEPWEPNITAETEREEIKWRRHLSPDVPIPTPDTDEWDGVVGLFEGAGYKARGLYRPTRDSKMFHKGLLPFGPVSEAAIERMIAYLTGGEVAP